MSRRKTKGPISARAYHKRVEGKAFVLELGLHEDPGIEVSLENLARKARSELE